MSEKENDTDPVSFSRDPRFSGMQFERIQLDLTGKQYVFYRPDSRNFQYPLQFNDRALGAGMQFSSPTMQSMEFIQGQGGPGRKVKPLPIIP